MLLSPDCSGSLIFNKRNEEINQGLSAALTKTLNVLYGVSKHAPRPSLLHQMRGEGRGKEREMEKETGRQRERKRVEKEKN